MRGDRVLESVGLRAVNLDQLVSAGDGQIPDQYRVHDAEHRGVRTDTERQRGDRDDREPRRPQKAAQRVAKIVEDASEDDSTA